MSGTGQEYEERKVAVAAALRDLERCLGELTRALAHAEATIAVKGTSDPKQALGMVGEAYAAIEFVGERGDEPAETVLGVVGVPYHVVERARAVNNAKDRFKAACNKLWDRKMSATVKDGKGRSLVKPMPWVRLMLRELGRPRLSMLAAYRHIPILEVAPLKVAYVNARTRSVYRRRRQDLIDALSESSAPGAAEDLARLRRLPPSEQFLAEVRPHYPQIRANVNLPGQGRRDPQRKQVGATLPLLYDRGGCGTLPVIRFPGEGGPARNANSPIKKRLQEEPYLTSMAIHRYADPVDARCKR